jgi:hypothetical protein
VENFFEMSGNKGEQGDVNDAIRTCCRLESRASTNGSSLFSLEWGHEGNPKAETRNPKEARNPKSDPVALRGAGLRECAEPKLRLEPLDWPPSGFGLRISFGFRVLDFELWP